MRDTRLALWLGFVALLSIPLLALMLALTTAVTGDTTVTRLVELSVSFPYVIAGSFLTAFIVHRTANKSRYRGAFLGVICGPLNAPLSCWLRGVLEPGAGSLWTAGPVAPTLDFILTVLSYGSWVALPCGVILGALVAREPGSLNRVEKDPRTIS